MAAAVVLGSADAIDDDRLTRSEDCNWCDSTGVERAHGTVSDLDSAQLLIAAIQNGCPNMNRLTVSEAVLSGWENAFLGDANSWSDNPQTLIARRRRALRFTVGGIRGAPGSVGCVWQRITGISVG